MLICSAGLKILNNFNYKFILFGENSTRIEYHTVILYAANNWMIC